MKKSLKKLAPWLKWVVAISLLALLYYLNHETFEKFAQQEKPVDWSNALGALALCFAAILLTFYRWFLLLWALEMDVSLKDAMRLGFLGFASNFISLGAVGGDVVKAVVIARHQDTRRMLAVATVLLDRILGLLALFIVGASVAFFQSSATNHAVFRTTSVLFWTGSIVGLIVFGAVLHPAIPKSRLVEWMRTWPYVGKLILEFLNGVQLYQKRRKVLVFIVLISVIGHFLMLSSFYFCGIAVNSVKEIPDYFAHLLFMPAAEIAAMIPIAPGGVGTLEASIAYFYALAGSQEGAGTLMGFTYRAITLLIAGVGIVFYFSDRKKIVEAMDTSDDVNAP